jgi:hypothetical protein
LFTGSEGGAHTAAVHYSIVLSSELDGIGPLAYLRDVMGLLPDAMPARVWQLIPLRWAARSGEASAKVELDVPATLVRRKCARRKGELVERLPPGTPLYWERRRSLRTAAEAATGCPPSTCTRFARDRTKINSWHRLRDRSGPAWRVGLEDGQSGLPERRHGVCPDLLGTLQRPIGPRVAESVPAVHAPSVGAGVEDPKCDLHVLLGGRDFGRGKSPSICGPGHRTVVGQGNLLGPSEGESGALSLVGLSPAGSGETTGRQLGEGAALVTHANAHEPAAEVVGEGAEGDHAGEVFALPVATIVGSQGLSFPRTVGSSHSAGAGV